MQKMFSLTLRQRSFRLFRRISITQNNKHTRPLYLSIQNDEIECASLYDWSNDFVTHFFYYGAGQQHYLKLANRDYQSKNNGQVIPKLEYNQLKSTLNKCMINQNEKIQQLVISNNKNILPNKLETTKINTQHITNTHSIGNMTTLDMINGNYDVIILNEYLSCIPIPEQRLHIIQMLSTYLRPQGYLHYPHRMGLFIIAENIHKFQSQSTSSSSSSSSSSSPMNNHTTISMDTNNDDDSSYNSSSDHSHKNKSGDMNEYHKLLNEWRQTIKNTCDFELIKQRTLKIHINSGNSSSSSSSNSSSDTNYEELQLFIFGNNKIWTNTTNNNTTTIDSNIRSANMNKQMIDMKLWFTSDYTINTNSNSYDNNNNDVIKELDDNDDDDNINIVSAVETKVQNNNNCINRHIDAKSDTIATERKSKRDKKQIMRRQATPSDMIIGIVGGGLGGTALALSLQQHGIKYKIYEKDISFGSRRQGYALTVQQGSIMLRALGVLDKVMQAGHLSLAHVSLTHQGDIVGSYGVNGIESQQKRLKQIYVIPSAEFQESTHIVTKKSELSSKGDSSTTKVKRHNIHIPRQTLRDIMLTEIDPSHIIWNKKLIRYEEMVYEDDKQLNTKSNNNNDMEGRKYNNVKLYFDDGSSDIVTVLVASDGIHSTIRKQLEHCQQQQQRLQHDYIQQYDSPLITASTSNSSLSSTTPIPTTTTTTTTTTDDDSIREDMIPLSLHVQGKMNYLGMMVILGISPNVLLCEHENTDDCITCGRHQVQWVDGKIRVFTMPYDSTHTMWQLSFHMDESEALHYMNDSQRLKKLALEKVYGWHSPLIQMIESTEDVYISGHPAYDRHPYDSSTHTQSAVNTISFGTSNMLTSQPHKTESTTIITPITTNVHSEPSTIMTSSTSFLTPTTTTILPPPSSPLIALHSYVTLLGDAAHPMSPFKGQGANQALLDAHSLVKALISSCIFRPHFRPITEALREYEREMWDRSAVKVLKSRSAAEYLHSDVALAQGDITRAAAAEVAKKTSNMTTTNIIAAYDILELSSSSSSSSTFKM